MIIKHIDLCQCHGKKIGFVILIDLFASKTDYSDVDSSLYSLTSARADSSSP